MEYPPDRKYSEEHEWVAVDGDTARVGITDYAQDALGDVVFVQVPDVGLEVVAGASCAEVESTKSVSEIYSPVSGMVGAVNEALADEPENAELLAPLTRLAETQNLWRELAALLDERLEDSF